MFSFAAHDRNNVEEELFQDTDLVLKIVERISEIGEMAVDQLKVNKKSGGKGGSLQQVKELFEPVVGILVEPPPPQPMGLVPKYRDYTPGDRVTVTMHHGRKGGTWTIPPEIANGEVQYNELKTSVSFMASSILGEHTITYIAPGDGGVANSTVEIVEQRAIRLSPGFITTPPLTHELTLENCDDEPANIQWQFLKNPDEAARHIQLIPSTTAKSATVIISPSCPPGTYTIVARPSNGAQATANIFLPRAKNIVQPDDLRRIAGKVLILQGGGDDDPGVYVELRPKTAMTGEGKSIPVDGSISINPEAPEFRGPKTVRDMTIKHTAALHVFAAERAQSNFTASSPEQAQQITVAVEEALQDTLRAYRCHLADEASGEKAEE